MKKNSIFLWSTAFILASTAQAISSDGSKPTIASNSTAQSAAHSSSSAGDSLNELGEAHHFGKGVPQNFQKAQEFYLKAVEHKNPTAANHLGRLYLNGEGVEKDPKKAEEWYKKSVEFDGSDLNRCVNGQFPDRSFCALLLMASKNNPEAMVAVGECYMNGISHGKTQVLQPHPLKAKEWLIKATQTETQEGLKAYFFLYYGCKEKLLPCEGPDDHEKWKKEGAEKGFVVD